jgi:SAM-dependent methyltransferase
MPEHKMYGPDFYDSQVDGARRSAKTVVPIVYNLIRPKSVVDVGCGRGTWLRVFKEYGVNRILGIDGDYIDRDSLEIPADCFRAADLNRPLAVDQKFDLAVCLEVAEHIPPAAGVGLVKCLTQLAPVVLFSAAVPLQGGTHHVNEQWPDYWAAAFLDYTYKRIDAIRKLIWKNHEVDWWYRQNVFLFVREGSITLGASLTETMNDTNDLMLIHADVLEKHTSLRHTIKRLPSSLLDAAVRKMGRSKGNSRND